MSTTDRNRIVFLVLFVLVVLVGLAGWIGFGRDVADLTALFVPLVAALGIGEASNIGKRATYKPEVAEVEAKIAAGG